MTFKVGDRVRILDKDLLPGETLPGWDNCWVAGMDRLIGQEGTITMEDHDSTGLAVTTDTDYCYLYHPSMLELVKEKLVFELKPFMRVQTKARGMWLVIPTESLTNLVKCDSEFILVNDMQGWNPAYLMTEEIEAEEDNLCGLKKEYAIVKAFAPPSGFMYALNLKQKGDLLWQYESQRKREIRELKEKLAQLEQEENGI